MGQESWPRGPLDRLQTTHYPLVISLDGDLLGAATATTGLDRVFGALSDRTRRSILERLTHGEASVTELVEPSKLSQPAISKHLKVLERAGLVTRSRAGKFRPCRLDPAPLQAAATWLGDYRRFWEGALDNLDEYMKSLQAQPDQRE